jgi:serine/threonine protein kinase
LVDGGEPYAPGGLDAGAQIAGYQIEGQIGRGGMAVVYRATDLRLNRMVALKILAPELARDAAFRERFIREMRAAAAVDHPHIVPVFDAGEANGALYIAMLYASGHDVRTLIKAASPLPAGRVADIVGQVASALDAAHARGLIHRDVKPANMLMAETARDGRPDHVYLSDFGLSKQSFSSASLTLTGQFLGTLDYMAPEQVEGSPIDGRADLYGLACATYEMFTGEPPFKREHDFAAIWAQLSAPAPSLLRRRPDLSPAIDQVIGKALAKSPDDRYPACGDFASALGASCGLGSGQPQLIPPGEADHPTQTWPSAQPGPQPWPAFQAPASQPGRPGDAWPAAFGPGQDDPRPSPPGGTIVGYPVVAPQRQRQRRRPRPRAALIAGCLVLLAIIGIAAFLLRPGARTPTSAGTGAGAGHPAASGQPSSGSGSGQKPAQDAAGPAATVQAYIRAINSHDYQKAWVLGGKYTGESYQSFVQGFNGTQHDYLTIVSVSGNVVNIRLAAAQTDGTVQHYQGTYTVNDGSITASHIQRAG